MHWYEDILFSILSIQYQTTHQMELNESQDDIQYEKYKAETFNRGDFVADTSVPERLQRVPHPPYSFYS